MTVFEKKQNISFNLSVSQGLSRKILALWQIRLATPVWFKEVFNAAFKKSKKNTPSTQKMK